MQYPKQNEENSFESEIGQNDDMPNNSQWEEGKQVRGPELREKMIQSQRDGEDYRASHQGADVVRENFVDESK